MKRMLVAGNLREHFLEMARLRGTKSRRLLGNSHGPRQAGRNESHTLTLTHLQAGAETKDTQKHTR